MGEPQPGDFPSPIHIMGGNVLLKATQIGFSGGFVKYNPTGAVPAWEIIDATHPTGIIRVPWQQLQQDINSTGLPDGKANAGTFGPGSWIYGIATSDIKVPNAYVVLEKTAGNVIGFTDHRSQVGLTTKPTVASNILTVTFATGTIPDLAVGDIVTLSGSGDANLDGEHIVTVKTLTTWAAVLVTGNVVAPNFGFSEILIKADKAQAQFIKRSGDTFIAGMLLGEIGIFSVLKGGQAL